MYEKFGQFIDGKWQNSSSDETYDVINPANEDFSQQEFYKIPPTIITNTTDDMRISMAIDVHTGDEVLLNNVVSEIPKRFFYIR